MKNFFKNFTLAEGLIWGIGVLLVVVFFFAFENEEYLTLVASLVGITALLFVAKGNPIGQALTIAFAVLYSVISYFFAYYGEMITYLGMTAPMAVWALVSWLKHPSKERGTVQVNTLSRRERVFFLLLSAGVTVAFYFILRAFGTNRLSVSTLSVFTSFTAAYLTARRSRFYALCYALNDLVLIVLWALAASEEISYLPMVVCFVAFFASDLYGFFNWTRMLKKQRKEDC